MLLRRGGAHLPCGMGRGGWRCWGVRREIVSAWEMSSACSVGVGRDGYELCPSERLWARICPSLCLLHRESVGGLGRVG